MKIGVEYFTFQRIVGSICLIGYGGIMISLLLEEGLTNSQLFISIVTLGMMSRLLRGKYEVNEEHLKVKQGILNFDIRYEDISRIVDHTKVEGKGLNRIEVFYGENDYLLLTPRNKEELEQVFHDNCPHIAIKKVAA
jgi:hypothetical protein